tara:strand:+ start:1130 stop:1690 length:561 start_codon:yes stop_codon:yes gene_type:complete
MDVSNSEKLILLMLSEIYQKLGVDGEIDPKFIQSAINSDNLWGIDWKYSGIPRSGSQNDTPPIVTKVVDILDMWSFIEDSYKELSTEDKAALSAEIGPLGDNPSFQGFDGNNESEYLSVLSFLVTDLDRFSSFKGRENLNSHSQTIELYDRMLSVFLPMRKSLCDVLLHVEQLSQILSARVHPSSR